MDYELIVVCNDLSHCAEQEMKRKVNEKIKNGWIPQGGVSISVCESECYNRTYLAQAMIKLDE